MQHISKEISISDIVSRVNSTIPSHTIVWESPIGLYETYGEALESIVNTNYDASSIMSKNVFKEFDAKLDHQGNYGMVPLPIDGNKMGGSSVDKIVPFNQLVEWYGFLKKYYNEIGEDGTAEKHYLLETSKENVLQQELEEAKELDKRVDEINECFDGDSDKRAYEWISNNLFNENAKNVVVSMEDDNDPLSYGYISIPLSITADISDLGLMSTMEDNELVTTPNLIYNFRVGNIYNSVDSITQDNKIVNIDEPIIITKIGTTTLKISGCTGEWDARGTNTSLGVLRIASDTTPSGYIDAEVFCQKYHDFLCANQIRYDDEKCNSIPYSSITDYYYDEKGNVVYTPKSYREYNATLYQIGFFSVNGNNYEVNENYFVTYMGDSSSAYNGRRFPVFETTEHNVGDVKMLYCYVAEKKYIARIDNEGNYYFVFYNPNACDVEEIKCYVTTDKEKYIAIDGDYILVQTIDGNDVIDLEDEVTEVIRRYVKMKGFCVINAAICYIKDIEDSNLYKFNGFTEIDDNIYIENYVIMPFDSTEITNDGIVKVYYDNNEINGYFITGYTDSKLSIVRDATISVDMMGNQLPGNFEFDYIASYEKARSDGNDERKNPKFNEPYEGMMLEIPFHIGNINELENTELGLMGDILESITVKGYDWENNIIYTGITSMTSLYDENKKDEFLSFSLRDEIDKCKEADTAITSVKVSFIYKIACNLETSDETYPMYKSKSVSGISYKEEYIVEEDTTKYYTNDGDVIALRYYNLLPDTIMTGYDDDYGYKNISGPRAIFTMPVNIYSNGRWTNEDMGMDSANGDITTPLIRKDELIGYSASQNLSGNIYIDRGISTINEKQFRLMDARTVQALEKTGNYWFNIQEY